MHHLAPGLVFVGTFTVANEHNTVFTDGAHSRSTAPGPGMMQWNVQGLTPGLYLAELRVQGLPPQQVKVAVQH